MTSDDCVTTVPPYEVEGAVDLPLHARQDADGGWTCPRTTDPHEVGESARMLLTRAAAVEREQVPTFG